MTLVRPLTMMKASGPGVGVWKSVAGLLLWSVIAANSISEPSKFVGGLDTSVCQPTYYNQPNCIDHPDGYGCECGPGFDWNTHMCTSTAIDSRFEFKNDGPIRYTLLLGKAFPSLDQFTIAFWITINNASHPGTIFSYKSDTEINLLRMRSGPKLNFDILGHHEETDMQLIKDKWVHISLTWNSKTDVWRLYIDGAPTRQGPTDGKTFTSVPSGGEFVLGQSSRPDIQFNTSEALDGDLSHLNIWKMVLNEEQIRAINSSCTFMYCGDAVQWVEFRSGTRGAMKMRWPSGIQSGECFSKKESELSCDKFCSVMIGAQCNEEIKENIKWSRQPAQKNISVVCPSFEEKSNDNNNETVSHYATRSCELKENVNDGVWQEPFIDHCISDELLQLKKQFLEFDNGAINEINVLELADRLLNHTEENVYMNPIDVATVIDLVAMLVKTQSVAPVSVSWGPNGRSEGYPTVKQTETFCELLINIVNNLLAPRNEAGWNATRPSGEEGDNLMQVMHEFADVISKSYIYHINDDLILYKNAHLSVIREYIEFKIETQWVDRILPVEFPDPVLLDKKGHPSKEAGYIEMDKEAIASTNAFNYTVFLGISTFRYKTLARMLPTEEIPVRTKEDRINTPIMALYFHINDLRVTENLTSPIIIDVPILDTFNISNPECVILQHGQKRKKWRWSQHNCRLIQFDGQRARCACRRPGVFALITDMYDDNWDKGDKRPQLMNFASYFGCTMSATLCLIVCGIHTYLKTSTSTAALHRNLSVSIALSQIVFMFGIDRYESPAVCHAFAILLHYFFLATYSWVMNEAFNLYIVITYSAHNPSDLNDSGSMMRYYILGWALPAVLVGAFVGTSDNYYADDMCWVAPGHMWLFIGPAIGIMSITILVLIFTAKEHNENSYTKSDKTNKIINIHMKAVWTQVILVSVCWAFAFISIKMVDTILKYLYAMFTSLQGAFFVVFYMFLHEEVRAWIKSRQKRRALQLHGFEFQDNHSLDSFASNSLIDRVDLIDGQSAGTGTMGGESGSISIAGSGGTVARPDQKPPVDSAPSGAVSNGKEPRPPRLRELAGKRNKAHIEASSDEGSDCEMISSV